MDSSNYNSLLAVLAPLFIFNFTSLFMLSQENYGKFHSVKLLKMVFSSEAIFFTIIIPVLFIIFTVIDVIPTVYSIMYSVLGIIYGIVSSCFLIFRLRKLLDPIYIAKRIISTQRVNEFFYYKTAQISVGESVFDDLLELICGTINNNAALESRKLFDYIFNWFALNLEEIKPSSKLFYERQENRFNAFLYTIVETLIQKDNSIIKSHYVKSIFYIFLENIDFRDLSKIDFPLSSLKKLATSLIERGSNQDNQIASAIFYTIINPFDDVLSRLENSNNRETFFIEESEEFLSFKEIVLKNLKEIYDCAIKSENSEFIRQTTIARRFFNSYSGNDFIKWNNNYLKCYQEISYYYKKILESSHYDKKCADFILSEFNHFAINISYQDSTRTVIKHLFNSYIKDLFDAFSKLIDNSDYLKSHDFGIFYERAWSFKECEDYQLDQYLNAFNLLIRKYFDKFEKLKIFDSFDTKDLWMRIEQVAEELQKRQTETFFKRWNESIKQLKIKYSAFYEEYKNYIQALEKESQFIKEAIKNEEYFD